MQIKYIKKTPLAIASGLFIAGSISSAIAGDEPSIGLEEVIVTAQKREQDIQSIPISIASFGGQDIENRVMTEIGDLNTAVPNLVLAGSNFNGETDAEANIRGLPGVGIYIDDVYQASGQGLLTRELVGVERMNVLRGPQGTLFGKETSGGAIQIYTRKPDEEFGGAAKYGIGSGNLSDVNISVNLPITDTLATRITGSSVDRDGYVKSVVGGPDAGDINTQSLTIDTLWTPTDTFEARLKYAQNDFTQDAFARVLAEGGTIDTDDFEHQASAYSDTWWQEQQEASLHLAWDVSDSITIKSITAYTEVDYNFYLDYDGTEAFTPEAGPLNYDQSKRRYIETYTQEFQFIGNHDRLDWVAGAYYWKNEEKLTNSTRFSRPTGFTFTVNQGGMGEEIVEGYAVFGDATYSLTDKWSLSFGARYSDEEVTDRGLIEKNPGWLSPIDFSNKSSSFLLADLGVADEAQESFDNTSIRAAANYQLSDDMMLYVSYSEGFTSGGAYLSVQDWDGDPTTAPTTRVLSYDPEEVENYEFGVRSEWMDGKLRANASIFFTDYDGIQVSDQLRRDDGSLIPAGTGYANVATGEVQGLEFDLNYYFNENWNGQLSYGYTDAEYTDVGTSQDITEGSPFTRTPENSLNLSVNNIIDLAENGIIRSSATYGWKDEMSMATTDLQAFTQDAYGLLNARVSYAPESGSWSVSTYVSNATDELYYTGAAVSSTIGGTLASVGRGREYGLEVKVNF